MTEELRSPKRALIVLDMIEDLVGPSRTLAGNPLPGRVEEGRVAENINTAIAATRRRGEPVIFVNLGFAEGYEDWPETSNIFAPAKPNSALRRGTPGTTIIDAVDVAPSDVVLTKPRVSPFYNTGLEALLRTLGIGSIVLAGVATEHVVLAGARDGHDRDLLVTVLTDGCTSATDELKASALGVMGYFTAQLSVAEFSA